MRFFVMGAVMLCAAVAVLVGCTGPVEVNKAELQQTGQQRMLVVSSQTIQTSRYERRDMLVVKDTKTDQEYLLVQGFGAVEMVQRGKVRAEE